MPAKPQMPEAVEAAEAVVKLLKLMLAAPEPLDEEDTQSIAAIITEKMAPVVERAFKEGCVQARQETNFPQSSYQLWLRSKAHAALAGKAHWVSWRRRLPRQSGEK